MEHRPDGAERVGVVLDAIEKVVGVDVVFEAQRNEVLPLLAGVEAVDDDDVVEIATVQRPYHGAADETGSARYDDGSA